VPAGAVKTRFDFSASSHLLTEALLQGPISKLVWSYRYQPAPRSLAFAPPRSAKLVRTLFEHVDVKNADPAAKKVLDQALKAYSNLKQVAFTVDGPEKKVAIWINGNSFRERQPKLDWVYSGGVLTIQTFWNGKVYRGSCKPNAISSYLRILGQPMEPMLQALIVQRNPLDAWLHPSLRIRSKGRVKIGSLVCDAVELDSNFLEISLLVRQDNHLISTVTSRTLGEKKELLAENTRTLKYSSVQKQLPASTFRLPAKNYLPLSAIK
jgi:hypothetical protein